MEVTSINVGRTDILCQAQARYSAVGVVTS